MPESPTVVLDGDYRITLNADGTGLDRQDTSFGFIDHVDPGTERAFVHLVKRAQMTPQEAAEALDKAREAERKLQAYEQALESAVQQLKFYADRNDAADWYDQWRQEQSPILGLEAIKMPYTVTVQRTVRYERLEQARNITIMARNEDEAREEALRLTRERPHDYYWRVQDENSQDPSDHTVTRLTI